MSSTISHYLSDRQKLGLTSTSQKNDTILLLQRDQNTLLLDRLDLLAEQNSQNFKTIQNDIVTLNSEVKKIKEMNKLYIASIAISVALTGFALFVGSNIKLPQS